MLNTIEYKINSKFVLGTCYWNSNVFVYIYKSSVESNLYNYLAKQKGVSLFMEYKCDFLFSLLYLFRIIEVLLFLLLSRLSYMFFLLLKVCLIFFMFYLSIAYYYYNLLGF